MRLAQVPARRGMRWVRDGLVVFMRKPLAFSALFLIYVLVAPLMMLTVAPLASLGFMIATRLALAGRVPLPSVFLAPLKVTRPRLWAQLKLGLLYSAAVLLLLLAVNAVAPAAEAPAGRQGARQAAGASAASEPERQADAAARELEPFMAGNVPLRWSLMALGMALLAIPFWHAPALVHWGGYGAAQSLFFSVLACWRNKGALTVYSLGWVGVIVGFAFVSTLVFALFGAAQITLLLFMQTVGGLILSGAFYASLYFTFAESFELVDAPAGEDPTPSPETP